MSELDSLFLVVSSRRQRLDRSLAQRDLLLDMRFKASEELVGLEKLADNREKALKVLTGFSEKLRMECQRKIESLVTMGLQVVFERPYEFVVVSSIQRSVVSMKFLIRVLQDDGTILETDLYDSVGGGILDVVSFLLRVIVLSMVRPKLSRVLLLDEVFSHVSREYLLNVGLLLRRLCDNLGLQILLVSHSPELGNSADIVYQVRQFGGNVHLTKK